MKRETFCKKKLFWKKWDSKRIFFSKQLKIMQKVFNFILKKTVNSILKDLYEYLFLKIPAKKILLLNDQVIYYQRQHAYCNILMGRIAAGVCFEIITVIALHHPVSAAGSSSQKPKIPAFLKKHFMKTGLFRR